MKQMYELIDRVAELPTTVPLTGESGTSTELAARAIPLSSSSANVIARCPPATIPSNMGCQFCYQKPPFAFFIMHYSLRYKTVGVETGVAMGRGLLREGSGIRDDVVDVLTAV